MNVLSHRGYWLEPGERNSAVAFERSFSRGFGTETDLRDLAGRIVISHDVAAPGAMPAEELFGLHRDHDARLPLALNVKADGLQLLLKGLLSRFDVRDAFVFDMSVPDLLQWQKTGLQVFTRHSEIEPEPACYGAAHGVWLDAFAGEWWTLDTVRRHLDAGKRVCVVSPELHGREHRRAWDLLAASDINRSAQLMICTDLPEDARRVFGREN
jgi:hypothetical protein